MLSAKKLCWTALGVALVAIVLMVMGCGGGGNTSSSSGTTKPVGTPDTRGVTDTEILLGTHVLLSQSPAAAYGIIADGMKAYFEYINSQGGVYGRKIKLIVGDDHFSPPDAVEVVRSLVERDGVFAIVGGLGDSTHLAVMDYLAEKGVPDLFIGGGMPSFTDPLVKTRFAITVDYVTEGKILSAYVKEHFAGKREGIIYENVEAGRLALQQAEEAMADSNIKIVSKQAYDFSQFDLTSQVQRLKADNPDFVYMLGNPGTVASAL